MVTWLLRVDGELRRVRSNSFRLAFAVARLGWEFRHGKPMPDDVKVELAGME